jgi:hypothetical protein
MWILFFGFLFQRYDIGVVKLARVISTFWLPASAR